ncbi:MAG: energy transducer TonB [Bacteroidota bacterium]
MKNRQLSFIVLLLLFVVLPRFGVSQERFDQALNYEVNKVYPYLSITKEKLQAAHTLVDLNERYKPSWINTYIAVEISASHQGKIKSVIGENDLLSQAQKDLMTQADVGTDIAVNVRYIPENNLRHNEEKEINFTFLVDPENEARYISGPQQLNQYLKEKAIDLIPDGHFQGFALAAVKFTINEEGAIINAHVFETSKDENIDALLLKAITDMPCWQPAAYANGVKAKQEWVLTIGNMENCIVHLLNVRRD